MIRAYIYIVFINNIVLHYYTVYIYFEAFTNISGTIPCVVANDSYIYQTLTVLLSVVVRYI